MTETINGLHKCQEKNTPTVGQTKSLSVINMPSRDGKRPWIKIRSDPPEKGGQPYRIVSVNPTGRPPDDYGNISFNLEVEAVGDDDETPLKSEDKATVSGHRAAQAETNGKIESYAKHAGHIFAKAWEESKNAMELIPTKDAEELSAFEWLDLRLRIAQGFTIEINKIIRKERF